MEEEGRRRGRRREGGIEEKGKRGNRGRGIERRGLTRKEWGGKERRRRNTFSFLRTFKTRVRRTLRKLRD